MFDSKYVYKYLGAIAVIGLASYYGNQIKQGLSNKDENDELIRQYLLNESPLYGFNRPKLWIHSKYEVNSRKWKDFMSRNTTDLNQPYLHLTIKTIVNHCGEDFNVCLIDDETFSRLIPDWEYNMDRMTEPEKSYYRELGMLKLLYIYGGVVLPNSFICIRSVLPLYDRAITDQKPYFAEEINRTCVGSGKQPMFVPGTKIMSAYKACPTIKDMIVGLEKRTKSQLIASETAFVGGTQKMIGDLINGGSAGLIGGREIGIKTVRGKQILLDDLMGENYLDIDTDVFGIYIPGDEVLSRPKFQWLAYLSNRELLQSKLVIVKYLKASVVDAEHVATRGTMRSVTAI